MFRQLGSGFWISAIVCIILMMYPSSTAATAAGNETTTKWNNKMDQFDEVPSFVVTILIIAFTISTLLSLGACITLWVMFLYLYRNVYRIMWSLEEKLRVGNKRLNDRKFGDDIMAQLRQQAPFDNQRNDQEIK